MRRTLGFAAVALAACGDSTGTPAVRGLRFVTVPATIVAGEPFAVTAELVGGNGERVEATREVIVERVEAGALVLSAAATAVDGIVTFPELVMTRAATGLTISARSGTFTAESPTFAVVAAAVSPARSTVSPAPGTVPPNSDVEYTFAFRDEWENPIPNREVVVSTSLAGSSFTPFIGETSAAGTFVSTFRSTAVGSTTIGTTVSGVPVGVSAPYVISDLCPYPTLFSIFDVVNGIQPCGPYSAGVVAPSDMQFTIGTAAGLAFTVRSTFAQPVFEMKRNATSSDLQLTSSTTPVSVYYLVPAGTFRFRVTSFTGPGTFSIGTSTLLTSPSSGRTHVLVASGMHTGVTLFFGDARIGGSGEFYDLYYLRSPAACTITLRSATFNPYLIVFDAITGDEMGVADAPLGEDAVIALPACRGSGSASNPVAIVATSEFVDEMGAYSLILDLGDQGAGLGAGMRALTPSVAPLSVRPVHTSDLIRPDALRKPRRDVPQHRPR